MTDRTKSPDWLDRARAALDRYREELLRHVAAKLIRPRQQWPADELRERMIGALDDPVATDRTLKTLSAAARQILKIIDLSRCPRWPVQAIVDLLPLLGAEAGIEPLFELLNNGFVFPEQTSTLPLESFEAWHAHLQFGPIYIFTVPQVAERCRGEELDLAAPVGEKLKLAPAEADGLEWPLRVGVMWQAVRGAALRRTQSGGLFKRDLDRLRSHPVLGTAPADARAVVADPALLTFELGRGTGALCEVGDEIEPASLPPLIATEFWSALWGTVGWDPLRGYENGQARRNWLQTAGLAFVAALNAAPAQNWIAIDELAAWLSKRQPDTRREIEDVLDWCKALLLGVLHSLKAVEASFTSDGCRVRLSAMTRDWLRGAAPSAPQNGFTQTLLVQPNLDVILYRQGLTPALAGTLTRFAEWKSLGPACTLTLTPESVYRGLESGLTSEEIQRTLERHSTRPLSDSVLETLRSWASKRERVQVYSSAVLLEFRTPGDLDLAMKQGLVEERLTDRIGLVSHESKLDYSRFRLVGSRDYLAAEEPCVEVGDDGLTLTIHDGRADLLLAAEVRRFADPIDPMAEDRSRFRAGVVSFRRAREGGIDLRWLDEWFQRRTGFRMPPTARLLFGGAAPLSLERLAVLRMPTIEAADGLECWPAAEPFLIERLGPSTFAVGADKLAELKRLLAESGLPVDDATLP